MPSAFSRGKAGVLPGKCAKMRHGVPQSVPTQAAKTQCGEHRRRLFSRGSSAANAPRGGLYGVVRMITDLYGGVRSGYRRGDRKPFFGGLYADTAPYLSVPIRTARFYVASRPPSRTTVCPRLFASKSIKPRQRSGATTAKRHVAAKKRGFCREKGVKNPGRRAIL